jgi:hypothetical protein
VAAPWLPNERQIKARDLFGADFSVVIPGHRAAMNYGAQLRT